MAWTAVLLLLTVASPASASGPPRVGGETEARFMGTVTPGKGRATIEVAPETHRAYWAALDVNYYCTKNGKRLKLRKPFLLDKPAKVNAAHAWSGRFRGAGGYLETWKLRFAQDWSKVTGRFSATWRSTAGERCQTGSLKFSARHVYPTLTWELGPYAGATAAGLPVSMTATWDKGMDRYEIQGIRVGVRLRCDDGSTRELTLRDRKTGDPEQDGAGVLHGEIEASVSESGSDEGPGARGTVRANLAGRTINGVLSARDSYVVGTDADGDDITVECEAAPVSFTATR